MSQGQSEDRLQVPDYGEMVERRRLLDLFTRTRPRITVIAAPAAYGKSVFAAQIARNRTLGRALWLRLPRKCDTAEEILAAALGALEMGVRAADDNLISHGPTPLLPDLIGRLESTTLSLVHGPACLVLDNLDSTSSQAVADLCAALVDRHASLTYVLAVRATSPIAACPVAVWQVGAADLLVDDDEATAVVRGVLGQKLEDSLQGALAEASGRQIGLLSVLARYVVSEPQGWEGLDVRRPDVCELLRHLAGSQLTPQQRTTLQCMALLGEGRVSELRGVTELDLRPECLRAISAAIPMARLAGSGQNQAFVLHELAQNAFGLPADLHKRDPAALDEILWALCRRDDELRILRLLGESDDLEIVEDWLERVGFKAMRKGQARGVDDALARVPAIRLVKKPRLLVLKSAAERELGATEAAVRSARAARELAEQDGDSDALANALIILAQATTGQGDFLVASAYFDSAIEACGAMPDSETATNLLGGRLVMSVLLGDYARFQAAETEYRRLRAGLTKDSPQAEALVDYYLSTAVAACTGRWAEYCPVLQRLGADGMLPYGLRVAAAYNLFACLVETGRPQQAATALGAYRRLVAETGNAAWNQASSTLAAVYTTMNGDLDCAADELVDACLREWNCGERLSAVTGLLSVGLGFLAGRSAPESLGLAELALGHAEALCAAPLIWHARLERAAALLASGDVAAAARNAGDVRACVEDTPAAYLHLKADTILAEIDCRNGDTTAATDRFREHIEYILTESANWQLAMYVRTFPSILGPLAAAVGAADLPVHLLNMILPKYAEEALAAAHGVLPPGELDVLSTRLLGKPAAGRRAGDRAVKPDVCDVGLFGGLRVDVAGRVVQDKEWRKRKARLLFAMLTSRCGKDIPREQLTEYLWPEMDEAQALNNLYVVWSAMKHALIPGSGRADRCPYVEHRGGVCRAVQKHVRTDLDDFDEQLTLASRARSAGNAVAELACLQRIAEVYRGELLPGEAYDDWFAALRERCRHDFEDAMLRAAQLLENRGDLQGGLRLLRRALLHDPWREDLYQAALRLQILTGQRSAAIETYLTCRSRLVEDLGIDPSLETTRLYEQVLGMEDGPSVSGTRPRNTDL